jgi:hypothetical protein
MNRVVATAVGFRRCGLSPYPGATKGLGGELHSGLYALTYILAGTLIFLIAMLCSIGFVVEGRCGATFGYYGCDTQH